MGCRKVRKNLDGTCNRADSPYWRVRPVQPADSSQLIANYEASRSPRFDTSLQLAD